MERRSSALRCGDFLNCPGRCGSRLLVAVGIVVAFVLCWIVFGFGSLLGPKMAFAYFLGVTFTIGLGVGLMTLVFYSNRSGQDDAVRDAAVERQDPAPRPKS